MAVDRKEVALEGYLGVLSKGKLRRRWDRRYLVLKRTTLIIYDEAPSLENDMGLRVRRVLNFGPTGSSVERIEPSAVGGRQFAFRVGLQGSSTTSSSPTLSKGASTSSMFSMSSFASASSKSIQSNITQGGDFLVLHGESDEETQQWLEAIADCMHAAKKTAESFGGLTGNPLTDRQGWLTKRAIKSGRNWKKRYFVLRGGLLGYYEQPPPSENKKGGPERPKGVVELDRSTIVRDVPIKSIVHSVKRINAFIIENDHHKLYISAESLQERAEWVYAIFLSILRLNGITKVPAIRVCVWLRSLGLQHHCNAVVLRGGLDSLTKVVQASQAQMQEIIDLFKIVPNDARKLKLAARNLRRMSKSEFASVGLVLGFMELDMEKKMRILETTEVMTENAAHVPQQAGPTEDQLYKKKSAEELAQAKEIAEAALTGKAYAERSVEFAERRKQARSHKDVVPNNLRHVEREHRLYTWGEDRSLQLGLGMSSTGQSSEPTFVTALKNKTEPGQVVCGRRNMAAVTRKERALFTWGSGGAILGLGAPKTHSNRPFLVPALRGVRIGQVAIGDKHMAAITQEGDLLTWGKGKWGQLGLGPEQLESYEPAIVRKGGIGSDGNRRPALSVACSANHTLVLVSDGILLTMGAGGHGRLGLETPRDCFEPTSLEVSSETRFGKIAVGDDFSVAVSSDGHSIFLWGSIEASKSVLNVPTKIEPFDERPVAFLCAEAENAMFLVQDTSSSSVYTMGDNALLLGHGDSAPAYPPRLVEALEHKHVEQLSCSATHAAALCSDGELCLWGEDTRGQLGGGHLRTVPKPVPAVKLSGFSYLSAACGVGSTAAILAIDESHAKKTDSEISQLPGFGQPIMPPPPPEDFEHYATGAGPQMENNPTYGKVLQSLTEIQEIITTKGLTGAKGDLS